MTHASEPVGGLPVRHSTKGPGAALALPAQGTVGTSGRPDAAGNRQRRQGAAGGASRRRREGRLITTLFLGPALVILAAVVVVPIFVTIYYSFFNKDGTQFEGIENYKAIFHDPETTKALRNNAIWVVVAPSVVTALGLVFAVLTDKVRFAAAFKLVMFMPMAISFLAAGVTFDQVYQQNKDRGALNAVIVSVHDFVKPPGRYTGTTPRDGAGLSAAGQAVQTDQPVTPGTNVRFPMLGLTPDKLPKQAAGAAAPAPGPGLRGTVWLDFAPGGGGTGGAIDPAEKGTPDMTVEAVRDGTVKATTKTDASGRFAFPELTSGEYTVRLAAGNFRQPYAGVAWLSGWVVTPAIIAVFVWVWAGFAMVLIRAGLASIPSECLEAARVDGASEWQVFRQVTIPLVRPVLIVVMVTLTINVMKIFDLVYVLARDGQTQREAGVVALLMYTKWSQNQMGLSSALAVLLFLLVLPAMLYNVRKLRREQ